MRRFSFLLLFLLIACQRVDLHHGLTEIEVDQILYLLQEGGVHAQKGKEVAGQEVSWKIEVSPSDLTRARQILIANNLPRRKELGLAGVYKEKGLIPTPDEQRARFLLALKGEIINSLAKVPGVVDADVVLNVPEEDVLSQLEGERPHPTASVVVKTRPSEGGMLPITEGKVQRFVANAVPKMDPNDVAVIIAQAGGYPETATVGGTLLPISPAVSSSSSASPLVELAGIRMDRHSIFRVKGYFIGLLSLLVLVAFALLLSIVRYNRLRVRVQSGTPVEALPVSGAEQHLLGGGQVGRGGVEGTFDIGRKETMT